MTISNETGRENRCSGCGARLQSVSPGEIGYVPEAALGRQPVICQRCFRIKHYNEISAITVDPDEFFRMLDRVGEIDALVVHVVDLFDFEGSLISGLHRFVGNNPIVVAANKIDLLPQSVNPNRIMNWVRRHLKLYGLKATDVVLCSAKQRFGIDRLVEKLNEYRDGRDVIVVGATNVGKSTLINRLIRDYSDLNEELTVSPYPGTTLDLVRIPLSDGKSVIDTPGVVYKSRLSELVPKTDLRFILPEKPIKPLNYQLNDRQTLFFGGLVRFDFVEGERQSFTCYVSNALPVHRTKLERADSLYAEQLGNLLKPPDRDRAGELPPLVKHGLRIPPGSNNDVLISGIGWVKVNGNSGAQLVVHAPKGVKVAVREAMI